MDDKRTPLQEQRKDIEGSIKTTMLIQEDTFKQQVRELHRLYAVQKILMNEFRARYEQHPCLQGPGEGQASASASGSSRGSNRCEMSSQGCNQDAEVELTLSLGGSTGTTAAGEREGNEETGRSEAHWLFRGMGAPRPSR